MPSRTRQYQEVVTEDDETVEKSSSSANDGGRRHLYTGKLQYIILTRY